MAVDNSNYSCCSGSGSSWLYFAYPAIKRGTAPAAGAADILKAETDRVRQSCETNAYKP